MTSRLDDELQKVDETGPGWRHTVTIVLLTVLFFVAATANISIWFQTTIRSSDAFVSALAPLPQEQSVAEALGQAVADAAIDTEQVAAGLADRLPSELQPLAVPVATAANEFAAVAAVRLIESDQFDAVWERTLQAAHTAVVDFLSLRRAANELRVDVTESAQALGDKLESLGIDVTVPDAPTVSIVQSTQDSITLTILRLIYSTGWVFPALFAALVVAVAIIYPDRRTAAWWLGGVTAGAMLFDLLIMRVLRADLVGQATNNLVADALREGWDTVTAGARQQTWLVLLVALAAMVLSRYVGTDVAARFEAFPSPPTAAFLDRWGTLTSTLVIIVAAALLLFAPSMTFGLALIITVVAAAAVVVVSLGKRRARSPMPT